MDDTFNWKHFRTFDVLSLVFLVALWSAVHGYYDFQTKIPNGQHVPHPCKPNFLWHGVGHENPRGGGARNQFGKDFASHAFKWSVALCQMDSDGDGRTNGEELGDPHCVWTEGAIPEITDHITHPGVCDPWDSPQCRSNNTWVSCEGGNFVCPAVNETGVQTLELRFPRSKVPAAVTTYACFLFDVPHDQPYHLIAFEPIIDNPNVMHHMSVMICDDTAELVSEPQDCGMGPAHCTDIIAIWTLGMAGDCFHREAGFRFGAGSTRRLVIQNHWTNPHLVDNWYDSSGMRLYYTPNLRPYDAAVITIGQLYLEIPPSTPRITFTGEMSAQCSRDHIRDSLKVVSALNHMHYLGVGGRLEVIRDGRTVFNLTDEYPYSYDSPHVYYYDNPRIVRPGDVIKMTCDFSSVDRKHTTLYGLGTYEEMCFGLLTYFPQQNFDEKLPYIQWKNVDLCSMDFTKISQMFNESNPETKAIFQKITDNCNFYGSCRSECPAAIAEIRASHSEYGGPMWEYIKYNAMGMSANTPGLARVLKVISAIDTCDRQSPNPTMVTPTSGPSTGCPGGQGTTPGTGTDTAGSGKMDTSRMFLELAKSFGSKPFLQNIIFNANGN